jgi:hypothetical protein
MRARLIQSNLPFLKHCSLLYWAYLIKSLISDAAVR